MNIKKSISAVLASALLVVSLGGLVATKKVQAATLVKGIANEEAYSYTVGYGFEALRDTNEVKVRVPSNATSAYLSLGTDKAVKTVSDFEAVEGGYIVTFTPGDFASGTPARGAHGFFGNGKYYYSASGEAERDGVTYDPLNDGGSRFGGDLYIANSYENTIASNGHEYGVSYSPIPTSWHAIPHTFSSQPSCVTMFDSSYSYIGEYYYTVSYIPYDSTFSRTTSGGSSVSPLQVPEGTLLYTSDMIFALPGEGFRCPYGPDQGAKTYGGKLAIGTYIYRVYNALGMQMEISPSDVIMVSVTVNSAQTENYVPTAVEPSTPAPIIPAPSDNQPVDVTVDGQPADVDDVVVGEDEDGNPTYDLTDDAKAELPVGPHEVVVTLPNGEEVPFTVEGTKLPVVTGVTVDGATKDPAIVTVKPDGTLDLTDAAKADLPAGPHTVVATLDDGSTKTFTVQGTGSANGNGNGNATPTHTPEQETGVAGFVERLYTVVLDRESDPNGKADWTNRLLTHQEDGRQVALGFLHSPEFLGKELNDHDWLTVLYRTFFDRLPDQTGYDYWTNNMNNGMTRDEVIDGFINSTEWATICWMYGIRSGGTGIPNTSGALPENEIIAFATRLYTTCLERNADPTGLISWAQILINGEQSGSQVAHGFFFSPEFLNSNVSDADYVTRLYRTFMDREPDTAGYNDWMSRIAAGATREDVFNGFTGSPEWAQRCAASGIVAN